MILCLLGGLAIAGPSGIIAWREKAALHELRTAQLDALRQERDLLQNRVALLEPESADPDLVSELIRRNLNVVHPDEVVVNLDAEQLQTVPEDRQ